MNKLLVLPFVLAGFSLAAQFTLQPAYPTVLRSNGTPYTKAWLGGLNAPQWNRTDLDGDGLTDLLLFDRAGDVLVSLKGDGAGGYTIDPSLSAGFPAGLLSWVLLRDYNGDGIDDLITYSASSDGVAVYRGQRNADGLLTYGDVPTYAGLRYPFGNGTAPIFITSIDYPAFDDIDGDGDLDVLTFSIGGRYVEYFKNQSVERGFGTDTLLYTLEDDCWGGFLETGQQPALDLAEAAGDCVRDNLTDRILKRRHAGSTVLALDLDGNGLKDILLGDINFDELVAGFNTGTREEAFVSRQDATYPTGGTPVDISFFPAGFHLDIDGDGNRDLVASPNQTSIAQDKEVGWYYRNLGTDTAPNFVLQTRTLLVGESLDFGTGALPAVFDYDADGRPDLVIGNTDAYSPDGAIRSQLRLLRNETPPGGATVFRLVEEDYLSLLQYQRDKSTFAPAFGDLDGDGDLDAIVGERAGSLIFFENTAGAKRTAAFADPVFDYKGIDVGQFAKPAVADLDRDGLNDLIVGGFNGAIRYYRNTGTTKTPDFTSEPTILQLGGINTSTPGFSTGHPTPAVLDYDNRFLLVTGNRTGTLEAYQFTDPTGIFTTLSEQVAGLDLGNFSDPATADFDGDGMVEVVIGNERGGVSFYRTDLPAVRPSALFEPLRPAFTFTLAPNPATTTARLSNLPGARVQWISVTSSVGQVLTRQPAHNLKNFDLQLSGLPTGFYTITVTGDNGVGVSKLLVR